MTGYVFAAKWDDGSAEITISSNGTAEHRAFLARSIGGPKRILHGDIPRKLKTVQDILAYCTKEFSLPVDEFRQVQSVGSAITYLREAPLTEAEIQDMLVNDSIGGC